MTELDPGHKYLLPTFDGELNQTLTFMKREGEGYPGNIGHYPGTNMQAVLRAIYKRMEYLETKSRMNTTKKLCYTYPTPSSRLNNAQPNGMDSIQNV